MLEEVRVAGSSGVTKGQGQNGRVRETRRRMENKEREGMGSQLVAIMIVVHYTYSVYGEMVDEEREERMLLQFRRKSHFYQLCSRGWRGFIMQE